MLSTQRIALLGFLICIGAVTTGLILEYGENLSPCLLCNTQRVLFIIVGLFYLYILVQKKIKQYFLSYFTALLCGFGIFISGWQVYLQSKPADDNGICVPSLSFVWKTGSTSDVFSAIFHGGGGQCSQVVWRFLGMSLAGWAFVMFVLLFVLNFFLLRPKV